MLKHLKKKLTVNLHEEKYKYTWTPS